MRMNMFGHGQWYNGELNPNQFATDPNGQMAQQQQQNGLPDAFNGNEMGIQQSQPSNGPLNNQNNPNNSLMSGVMPNLSVKGKILVGVGLLMVAGLVIKKVR